MVNLLKLSIKNEFCTQPIQSGNVLILCEIENERIREYSYELVIEGRRLANKLGVPLVAVVLGEELLTGVKELFGYGADFIYCIQTEGEPLNDIEISEVLVQIISKDQPILSGDKLGTLFSLTSPDSIFSLTFCGTLQSFFNKSHNGFLRYQ